MPKYRKLHVKIVDSADVNDMPDDFTRLAWTWLPIKLDCEGRGYDDPQWLRSVLFPRRRDVTIESVNAALEWWVEHKMVVRYSVNGQKFFHVPSFKEYQTGTDTEAKSTIPAPCKKSTKSRATPELVKSKSGVGPENSPSDSYSDSNTDADADANSKAAAPGASAPDGGSPPVSARKPSKRESAIKALETAFVEASGLPAPKSSSGATRTSNAATWWQPLGEILELTGGDTAKADALIHRAVQKLTDARFTIAAPKSILNTARGLNRTPPNGPAPPANEPAGFPAMREYLERKAKGEFQ